MLSHRLVGRPQRPGGTGSDGSSVVAPLRVRGEWPVQRQNVFSAEFELLHLLDNFAVTFVGHEDLWASLFKVVYADFTFSFHLAAGFHLGNGNVGFVTICFVCPCSLVLYLFPLFERKLRDYRNMLVLQAV